nr:phage portal protein [Butyrivibrio sp.]
MKIPFLQGKRKSRAEPANSYQGTDYSFLFGKTTSGKRVDEMSAMQTTAVYSCVRILSEAIASLPIHVYEYTKDGGKRMVCDHPLYHILHDEPNVEMSSFVFFETLMGHLLIWGNAYAQIIRDGAGRVISLYPLLPDKMEVNRDDKGQLYYVYSRYTEENPNADLIDAAVKDLSDNKLSKDEAAKEAQKLSEKALINGLEFDGSSNIVSFGKSTSAAAS